MASVPSWSVRLSAVVAAKTVAVAEAPGATMGSLSNPTSFWIGASGWSEDTKHRIVSPLATLPVLVTSTDQRAGVVPSPRLRK